MYLGLDLGTGSMKAAIVDPDGEVLWVRSEPYTTGFVGDRAEIDPTLWFEAMVALFSAAPGAALARVRAIGFSGQMHGTVLLDAAGDVLRPAILWPDRRAHAEVGELETIDRGTTTPSSRHSSSVSETLASVSQHGQVGRTCRRTTMSPRGVEAHCSAWRATSLSERDHSWRSRAPTASCSQADR